MTTFSGEIVRDFPRPADVLFPWLLWVEAFPRWFSLCHEVKLVDGDAESEGSVYRMTMSLGGILKKTVLMQIRDLDEQARFYRFVRCEDGNVVELDFAAEEVTATTSRIVMRAEYEGSGRILGIPVGGKGFIGIVERAVDRSLPKLNKLIATEEGA